MCERARSQKSFLSIYSFKPPLNKRNKFTESRNTSALPACLGRAVRSGSGRIEADCEDSKRKGAVNRAEREAIISSLEVL